MPDGSGSPLIDLTNYFYLPGRPGGQIGYGDTQASGTLTLSSTRETTKGTIYIGSSHTSLYDEANERLGLNIAAPLARLHVVGQAGSSFGVTSPESSTGGGWGLYSDTTAPPATYVAALSVNDDAVAYIARQGNVGTYGALVGLAATIASGTTYRITYRARHLGIVQDPTVTFTLNSSTGGTGISATIHPLTAWTTSWATYTADVTPTGSSGGATNQITINATYPIFDSSYVAISYISVASLGGGTGMKTAIFQAASGQGDTLSEWQDSSSVALVDITSAGILRIETGGGLQVLSSPGTGKLLTSDSTGLATWTTPSILSASHGDTLAAAVVAGDIIIGNATPKWSRLAIGTTGQQLTVVAGAPAWSTANLLSASHADTLTASVVAGDLLIGNATPKWARLAVGSTGALLTVVAGAPAWATTLTGAYIFDSVTAGNPPTIKIPNAGSDTLLIWNDGAGNSLTLLTSGAALSGAVVIGIPTAGGTIVTTSATQTLTNKTVSQGVINVGANTTPATAGAANVIATPTSTVFMYQILVYCTVLDAGGGTFSVGLQWTDDAGAQTATTAACPLTAVSTVPTLVSGDGRRSSGAITYTTTLTGSAGASKVRYYIRIS
jgi:hypothetical protein